MIRKRMTWGLWLRILCAFALLSIGFQHHAQAFPSAIELESAAYVLPDGSISALCAPELSDPGSAPTSKNYGCDACRLTASMDLAPTARVEVLHHFAVDIVFSATRYTTVVRRFVLTDAAPRAPPVFS